MANIVTGDDTEITVNLKKNGHAFVIPPDAIMRAALVKADHSATLAGPITVLPGVPGTDLAQSTIVVKFAAADTAAITAYRPALLEIEINDPVSGKTTWFVDVLIIKGQIA